jgi:Flp pilus assembly protein TadD
MRWRFGRVLAAATMVAAPACGRAPAPEENAASASPAPSSQVTFTRDVAPILFANCAPCHRPGQVAPFSLLSYDEARKKATAIADVTSSRQMPPWLPESAHPLLGDRRLRDRDIQILQTWAKGGAPEGRPEDLPAAPVWPAGWQLGKPDMVVKLPRAYTLEPGPADKYRQVVFPLELGASRFVKAVEFQPGSRAVHHAVIRLDRSRESRRKNGRDGAPGFEGVMAPDVRNPEGHFVGWAPGRGPIVSPAGMPWRLDAGVDLVVEMHMVPGAEATAVQPSVAFFFTDDPPTATPVELTMGVMTIDMAAGDPAYRVTQTIDLPADVSLLALGPHAHYLGHQMLVTAKKPDGSVDRLLEIKHWDFHWQQEYRFVTPVPLPRGTSITMTYTFDNSDANEHNPTIPPKRVRYGLQSGDEMANLSLQVLPAQPADARMLKQFFEQRHLQEVVAGAELVARQEPGNPERQWELGKAYVEVGRVAEAIPPLEAAVRANPKFARAHDYLGRALFAVRRPAEAFEHIQQAAVLDPGDELVLLDLGKMLADNGRGVEAMRAFDRVIVLNPEHAQAWEGRGVALLRLGNFSTAVTALERAVKLAPDSPGAENALAVALAQSGRTQEALQHVRRALAIDPSYKPAQDNLARMQRGR